MKLRKKEVQKKNSCTFNFSLNNLLESSAMPECLRGYINLFCILLKVFQIKTVVFCGVGFHICDCPECGCLGCVTVYINTITSEKQSD
jgi:hypothetical protein